jgi:hypothetical protein
MVIHHNRLSTTDIRGALSATAGTVKAAAARLSVQRNVLYRRMARHDIDPTVYRYPHAAANLAARGSTGGTSGDSGADIGGEVSGVTPVSARTEVSGVTQVFGGRRVFAPRGVTAHGADVHQCSPEVGHVPHSRYAPGKRYRESSSVGAVEDTVVDGNGHGDLVSRSLSLPRLIIALLLQQRRVLSAALDRDISLGAMLALFIEECLVSWVDQKAAAASQPNRPSTRNNGRKRRR